MGTMWKEYDSAALWCAQRGLKGKIGEPLPEGLSTAVFIEISENPEDFEDRVQDIAYALAMHRVPDRAPSRS